MEHRQQPGRVARLQQALVVGLVVLALAGCLLLCLAGHPAWAALWLCAVLGLNAATLGVEFLLHPLFNRGDPTPAPTPAQRGRAWAAEVCHSTQVFGWRQPWRSNAVPDTLLRSNATAQPPRAALAGRDGRVGVLLVHGFVCNRGVWTPALQRLRARDVPFVAVNLEPVFAPIDTYVPMLEAAIVALTTATGRAPLVVAHSMGGLAVRAWMRACRLRGEQPQMRVQHVVTIATPHHGTALAAFALAPNAAQMRRASRWLAELAESETPNCRAAFTCFYSDCDNIVAPASSATLQGADNRLIHGRAHVDLAQDPRIWAEVDRLLALPPAAAEFAASTDVDNTAHDGCSE